MSHEFSGRRVARQVVLLVLLTAVLPPAAAYGLAWWRIARAFEDSRQAAAVLASRKSQIIELAGAADVLLGPGTLPEASAAGLDWIRNPVSAATIFAGLWPDPWRRALLLDAGSLARGGSGLLISAGPNGQIETPLGATAPAGDDIAATVW